MTGGECTTVIKTAVLIKVSNLSSEMDNVQREWLKVQGVYTDK